MYLNETILADFGPAHSLYFSEIFRYSFSWDGRKFNLFFVVGHKEH